MVQSSPSSSPDGASCAHDRRQCINQYELIRKYECPDCGGVMMCDCDEDVGRQFRLHQTAVGRELETKRDVPVTLGFLPAVCSECRGLGPDHAPKAEMRGATKKFDRFYWREIQMETLRRVAALAPQSDAAEVDAPEFGDRELREAVRRQVRADLKAAHAENPKYDYTEPSQSEVLEHAGVPVREEYAHYGELVGRRVRLDLGGEQVSVEAWAAALYESEGRQVLETESRPFHALFAVFMWDLIADPADSTLRASMFGKQVPDRPGEPDGPLITLMQPPDFGAPGYGRRRAGAIAKHLSQLPAETDDMLRAFEERLPGSWALRQYLHLHDDAILDTARQVIVALTAAVVLEALKFLVDDYWHRYVGWPDLLVHDDEGFLFVEVKSSKDKLLQQQKRWIGANAEALGWRVEILKILRA